MLIGLYLHIPFCIKKCNYCDFYSQILDSLSIKEFIDCLLIEIEINSFQFDFCLVDTIYIGGGTPNVLSIDQIFKILNNIYEKFNIAKTCEITIEINPGVFSISEADKYFKALYNLGVNRISLGIQSFNNKELKLLGRIHSKGNAVDTYHQLQDTGFKNISIDLISSLPGQSISDYENTLKQAVRLKADHISSYVLKIELGTIFFKQYSNNDDKEAEFMQKTMQYLKQAGYIQYEISNYAKNKNLYSRHNLRYWERSGYLGLGPSAHSFLQKKRWGNYPDLDKYIKILKQGKIPVEFEEEITENKEIIEQIFLGLRTNQGVNIDLLNKDKMKELINKGLAFFNIGKLVLTEDGFLKADAIVEFLMTE